MTDKLSLRSVVGRGYDDFWNTKAFYRCVKGSKGSKKSYTAALWYIYHIMRYPDANVLVIRKVFGTMKNSAYATLQWAINRLGVQSLWTMSVNPMEMRYKPTGQKILFAGFSDALKLASITVGTGYLCWVWFEEAFEINNEEEFDRLVFSIRGKLPPESGLWKQITLTFNPWSEYSWIKKRFFDNPAPNVWSGTTTYKDNEFLGQEDIDRYEIMYKENPRMARIICDGEWGIAHGLIYNNWKEEEFDIHKVMDEHPGLRFTYGLDFGYAISFNAFVAVAVDVNSRELWVFDEMYDHGLPNLEIAKRITRMGYNNEQIWADAAEPKSIFELQAGLIEKDVDDNGNEVYTKWTLPNIRPSMKGPDSVMNGIQNLQSYKMHIHTSCRNTIIELSNFCYDQDKDGNFIDKPIKEFDHCLVAGTMVRIEHGEKPIEEIQNGEMVWTHKGLRKVLSAGITQLNQPIWCVEFENGTKLEGTWNHPIVTTKGVKYLKDITKGDEVIKWVNPVKDAIKMQNMLNMMGCCGIGIQSQTKNQREDISYTITSDYTDMCGKNTMGQYQKDATSIIKTEIAKTTTSQILNCSHQKNTCINTPQAKNCVNGKNNISRKTKTNAEPGTDPKKDISGIKNMLEIISGQSDISDANNAEKNSMRKTMDAIDFAHPRARQNGDVPPDAITRAEFVNTVVKNLQSTNIQEQDFVLVRAEAVHITDRIENVYDLTVDDAHDFFANDILTLNCLDALRYSMVKFFVRARGHVAEAKGVDQIESAKVWTTATVDGKAQDVTIEPKDKQITGKRIRRVFSTH